MYKDNANLKRLHDVNLKMLREVDILCKKYNIEYFLVFGGLLGSVRHKNFIPWDDDVDVCFKRSEFDKFLKVVGEISNEFEYMEPEYIKNKFFDTTHKIAFKNSVLRKDNAFDSGYDNKYNRVCLDLFIIDVTTDGFRYKIQQVLLKALYGMMISKRSLVEFEKYSLMDRIRVTVLSLLGKVFSLRKLLNYYDKVSIMNSKKGDFCFTSNATVMFLHKNMKYNVFEKAISGEIANESFPIPVGYDEALKVWYGDYMQLPPEDKRYPPHADFEHLKVW